jgi:general stress protein 26
MPSRREQIRLTEDEIDAYLGREKTVIIGSNGPRGVPHLMPLWFVMREGDVWGWTFAKSQKIKNFERDPRATLLFEEGVSYEQLRGVMLECEVTLDHDDAACREVGIELFTKYGDGNYPAEPVIQMIEAQAPKRVAMKFTRERVVSWDHGKLAGTY